MFPFWRPALAKRAKSPPLVRAAGVKAASERSSRAPPKAAQAPPKAVRSGLDAGEHTGKIDLRSKAPPLSRNKSARPGCEAATVASSAKPGCEAATAASSAKPGCEAATGAYTVRPGCEAATAAYTVRPGCEAATAAYTAKPGCEAATAAYTAKPGCEAATGAYTKPFARLRQQHRARAREHVLRPPFHDRPSTIALPRSPLHDHDHDHEKAVRSGASVSERSGALSRRYRPLWRAPCSAASCTVARCRGPQPNHGLRRARNVSGGPIPCPRARSRGSLLRKARRAHAGARPARARSGPEGPLRGRTWACR